MTPLIGLNGPGISTFSEQLGQLENFEAAPDAQAENGQLKTAFQRSFDVVSCSM